MKLIEINEIPPLSAGELSLLDAHGVINILNVLRCELQMMGEDIAQDSHLLRLGLALTDELLAAVDDPHKTLSYAANIEQIERTILEELEACLASSHVDPSPLAVSIDNIHSVLMVLTVRAREVLARAASPDRWEDASVERIESILRDLFFTIQKTSKRHYGIVLNAALKKDDDYYLDLRIQAPGNVARIPVALIDVLRDLSANARKYTAPGGRVIVALYQDEYGTRVIVEDTGCGIPPDEIESVVHFGKRASNVLNVRTMGGGFGLTKAFLTTKQFGGRFWIGSELGAGTIVRIWLPPAPAGAEVLPQRTPEGRPGVF